MSKTQEELAGVVKSPPNASPHHIFHHLRHGTAAGDAVVNVEPSLIQDPLVAFEHHLLARPANMPAAGRLSSRSLTVPSPHLGRRPSPSPDARRCMAATEAWTPRLDRRQSWDGQAYRRAMMVKATGILCGSAEANAAVSAAANGHESTGHLMGHPHCLDGHRHHDHFHHMHDVNGSCNGYEANRGFSECAEGTT